ncbi:MAG: hypothetical protein WA947_06580 [Phormidesmis sp.]
MVQLILGTTLMPAGRSASFILAKSGSSNKLGLQSLAHSAISIPIVKKILSPPNLQEQIYIQHHYEKDCYLDIERRATAELHLRSEGARAESSSKPNVTR